MANSPLPTFHFTVSWGGDNIGFSEVGGLSQEIQPIEYRDGLMNGTTLPLKRPGLIKSGNISLKRGMTAAAGNKDLYNWFINAGNPNVERRTLVVALLNDEGEPIFRWSIAEAWPVKCEGPALKATGNDIAIESIELAHEGIKILN
jgi:phage tail-like protein